MLKIKTYQDKVELSIKFSSIITGLAAIEKLCSDIGNIKINTGYQDYMIGSIVVENIIKVLPGLKQRFEENSTIRNKQIATNISYGIGIIKSITTALCSNNGNFYITLSLNLINSLASTKLITKLKEYNVIDGLSVAIIAKYILDIVTTGKEILTSFFVSGLLIATGCLLSNKSKNIDVHYSTGTKDKLTLNNNTNSLFISNTIVEILSLIGIPKCSIIVVNPLVNCFLNGDTESIEKNLKLSNGFISSHNCIEKYLDRELLKKNLIDGVINGVFFLIVEMVLVWLGIGVSTISIILVFGAVKELYNNYKAIKSTNVKGFLK